MNQGKRIKKIGGFVLFCLVLLLAFWVPGGTRAQKTQQSLDAKYMDWLSRAVYTSARGLRPILVKSFTPQYRKQFMIKHLSDWVNGTELSEKVEAKKVLNEMIGVLERSDDFLDDMAALTELDSLLRQLPKDLKDSISSFEPTDPTLVPASKGGPPTPKPKQSPDEIYMDWLSGAVYTSAREVRRILVKSFTPHYRKQFMIMHFSNWANGTKLAGNEEARRILFEMIRVVDGSGDILDDEIALIELDGLLRELSKDLQDSISSFEPTKPTVIR